MAKVKSKILTSWAQDNKGIVFFKKHGYMKLAEFTEYFWFVLLYKIWQKSIASRSVTS